MRHSKRTTNFSAARLDRYSLHFLLLALIFFGAMSCNQVPKSPPPFKFLPPAFQDDFPGEPEKYARLIELWNVNLNGFIAQGVNGDPWNATNQAGITNYFNPSQVSPQNAAIAEIIWGAWPGRIGFYYDTLPLADQLSISDRGLMANGSQPPPIPKNPCTLNDGQTRVFGPYGPRGFQDEYSEWSVQRDKDGVITRVDFTCENPEYWNSLWDIDPNKVLQIYQQTLDYATITMDDLVLKDPSGNPVKDPSTGRNVYNPLNKWNNGSGGAMHLTSTPNTLQTEIGLATSSTLQRVSGNADENALICCGQFGQNFRNSDPHIGGSVNRVVEAGFQVTLTNPPGLYIQMPNFSQYEYNNKPAPAEKFWTIVRGKKTLVNEYGDTLPGNYILHARFEVPKEYGYRVGDMTIADSLIKWGGQIARTYNMQIVASAIKMAAGPIKKCGGIPANPTPDPQQLFHQNVFDAMLAHKVPNPMNQPMNLLSNSTFIAPKLVPGSSGVPMVLTTDTIDLSKGAPIISFDDPAITAKFLRSADVYYAIPGNSYPGPSIALYIEVTVGNAAKPGTHGVFLSAANQKPGPAMPALLNIVQSIK
ncbi:MAG: hypothetical protein ACKVT2_22950 [Saprospiraceae bacterium]